MAVFEDDDAIEGEEESELEEAEATPLPSPAQTPGSQGPDFSSAARRRVTRDRVFSGRAPSMRHRLSVSQGGRRFSTSSGHVPALFSNTGLGTPPLLAAEQTDLDLVSPTGGDPFFQSPATDRRAPNLSVITERQISVTENSPLMSPAVEVTAAKPKESTWGSLPLLIIMQVSLAGLEDASRSFSSTAWWLCTTRRTTSCSCRSWSRMS